ncbi:hypothetical protein [Neisseria shayeganii]|uniref:Uncharacterized protein n=1 Tax=Neisseria shayeganii TaxID=607712 RepID=A0A7D7S966_9NEIS|nr:hypothetical protein [Neisseria shayeganii]QMT41311.1 hypothetical protein H3L94_04605 [Neisseria shayeganii]
MSNQNISDYVVLAEAAYADFSIFNIKNNLQVQQAIINTGKEDDEPNEKSTIIKMADYITSRYDVIAHHHDQAGDGFFTSDILNGSGFSATLFQDKVSKAYVLALKGSKGAQDLIGADLNDIVLDGLAHHQVDTYHFWHLSA